MNLTTNNNFIGEHLKNNTGVFFLINDSKEVILSLIKIIGTSEFISYAKGDSYELIYFKNESLRPSGANIIKKEFEKSLGVVLKKMMCVFVTRNATVEKIEKITKRIYPSSIIQIGRA